MNKGKLIIFEGPDFSGKSTQIKLLKPELIKNNNILYTREPGSYLPDSQSYCEQIRDFILNNDLSVGQEAVLFAESRFAHTQEMVRYINEGYNVICDRYIVSSLAYQGYAQNLGKDRVNELNSATIDLLEKNNLPIYCLKFILSEDTWKERKEKRLSKENADSIESKDIHDKVFEFYSKDSIYYDFTDRINIFTHTVDASKDINTIHQYVLDTVKILIK
jgi:dTMP kinase